jgi:hypothetical protein
MEKIQNSAWASFSGRPGVAGLVPRQIEPMTGPISRPDLSGLVWHARSPCRGHARGGGRNQTRSSLWPPAWWGGGAGQQGRRWSSPWHSIIREAEEEFRGGGIWQRRRAPEMKGSKAGQKKEVGGDWSSELTRRQWWRWRRRQKLVRTVSGRGTQTGDHRVGGATSHALDSKWGWCGEEAHRMAAWVPFFSGGRCRGQSSQTNLNSKF